MKKTITILLLLLCTYNIYALLPLNTSTENIITDITNISKLFPQTQGSEEETELIGFIKGRLEEYDIPVNITDFNEAAGYHSFSRIIEADIQGEKSDTLVMIFPLNRKENLPSGDDSEDFGVLNITAGLHIARAVSSHTPPVSIKLLFLGGEWEDAGKNALGTKLFLSSFYPESPVAVLYMDFPDKPGRIKLGTGGKGVVSPRWLIERTTGALNSTSLDYYTVSQETHIFRTGMGSPDSRVAPFLYSDYPAIYMGGETGNINPDEWIKSLLYFSNNFLENNQHGFPEGGEKHYQFLRISGETRLISESAYIRGLFLISMVLILYPFFARRRFKRYLQLLGRHVWIIPVMIILVFIFLLVGTFFNAGLIKIRNIPEFWKTRALQFFLLKITVSVTLYWILHKILKKLPFSRRGNFYSASAILFLILLFLIVCGINISFAYIVLWSLIFGFLFSIFRNRILKLTCLLLSMVWLVYFIYIIMINPYEELAHFLLFSSIAGNGFLSLLLLPHIFMFIRLSFLFFIRGKRSRKIFDRSILILLLALTIGLMLFLLISPSTPAGTPQPLFIRDEIDMDDRLREIIIESPAPFGQKTIPYDGELIEVVPGNRLGRQDSSKIPDFPVIESDLLPFLGRKEIRLKIYGLDEYLSELDLTLVSPDDLVLLDSNYPYSLDSKSSSARIFLGSNPPLPLELSFIFPKEIEVTAHIEFTFTPESETLMLEGKPFTLRKNIIYTGSLKLTGAPEAE